MRFVLNFIFFGFLFFLLLRYFPDQFNATVKYLTGVWDFVVNSAADFFNRAKEHGSQAAAEPAKSFILPFVYLASLLKK